MDRKIVSMDYSLPMAKEVQEINLPGKEGTAMHLLSGIPEMTVALMPDQVKTYL
ncbi:hypothetical protein OWR28_17790 [Chryseobacterium sp. 1B4]